jgi:hypothetical protein
MPTTRRHRRQATRVPLEPALRVWFLTGSLTEAHAAVPAGARGFDGLAQLMLDWPDHPALWAAHAPELCAEYTAEHPAHRPWGWWRYAASTPRRQLAGSGRPIFGESWREFRGLPVLLDLDAATPPVFESEPACLRRLGLLTPDEVRRLEPAAVEPVAMVVCPDAFSPLGYAPRGEEPDDDDENAALDDEAAWPS